MHTRNKHSSLFGSFTRYKEAVDETASRRNALAPNFKHIGIVPCKNVKLSKLLIGMAQGSVYFRRTKKLFHVYMIGFTTTLIKLSKLFIVLAQENVS
jgi:hypothetical protein